MEKLRRSREHAPRVDLFSGDVRRRHLSSPASCARCVRLARRPVPRTVLTWSSWSSLLRVFFVVAVIVAVLSSLLLPRLLSVLLLLPSLATRCAQRPCRVSIAGLQPPPRVSRLTYRPSDLITRHSLLIDIIFFTICIIVTIYKIT